MYLADMHCDTISKLYDRRRQLKPTALCGNDLQVDLEKMKQSHYLVQNFAVFVDWGKEEDPYDCAKQQIRLFQEELQQNADRIRQARTAEDLRKNRAEGKISALLTLEEGESCVGDIRKLEEFYRDGVRMMTFTWNYRNTLASPASELFLPNRKENFRRQKTDRQEAGLTETGILFLERMEALGIIPDVSHISEAGFYDVLKYSKKPFAASHSNAYALCCHKRNMTDDMIRSMAERGGIIGVNYYGRFLEDIAEDAEPFGRVSRIADHIMYMIQTGGIACVGLGSDFDGMDGQLELQDCSHMEMLWEELKKRGLSGEQRETVFYRNVWNFYQELL